MPRKKEKSLIPVTLARMIARIHNEHFAAEKAFQGGVKHAIGAGNLLSQVKDSMPHGSWTKWVQTNLRFSIRTCQIYMTLHARRDELLKAQSAAHSIREALDILSGPTTTQPIALKAAEAVLSSSAISNFIATCQALRDVRDGALYRQTHDTWGNYLCERWQLTEAQADRFIGLAGAMTSETQEVTQP